jgi:hypothetical protein
MEVAMKKKKAYFSRKKYLKFVQTNKFKVFEEDFLLAELREISGDMELEFHQILDGKEVKRPFIFFGNYRPVEYKFRKYKLIKDWIDWR